MSYKANVDLVVSFNEFFTQSFRKQGNLRFRMSIARVSTVKYATLAEKENEQILCQPYSILKANLKPKIEQAPIRNDRIGMNCQNLDMMARNSPWNAHFSMAGSQVQIPPYEPYTIKEDFLVERESYIDHDTQHYYSRVFENRLTTRGQQVGESCYFRAYVETQKLEDTEFSMLVELMQAVDNTNQHFEIIYTFEAIVNRLYSITTYLPIVFDEFEGFMINGVYQAAIMEFKFQRSPFEVSQFDSFEQYFEAVTQGLRKSETKDFYDYYHAFLDKELFSIQERHSDLLRILNINGNFGFVKVSPNQSIYAFIYNVLSDSFGSIYRVQDPESKIRGNYSYADIRRKAVDEISRDMLTMKGHIYQKWNEYISFTNDFIDLVTKHYKKNYDQNVKERLKNNVFSHRIEPNFNWTYSRYEDSGKVLAKQAEKDNLKEKELELWKENFPIYNRAFFDDEKKNIKIFEQICQVKSGPRQLFLSQTAHRRTGISLFQLNTSSVTAEGRGMQAQKMSHKNIPSQIRKTLKNHLQKPSQKLPVQNARNAKRSASKEKEALGQHIIILAHGYQASRQDFVLLKSCLQIRYSSRVFISCSNEGRTDDSIDAMGKRLANEVINYLKHVDLTPQTRISFIGHSMGGIIIRSALMHLSFLYSNLFTYMSFSSPHLGYLYQPSRIIQAGLWFLNQWTQSESLRQMCMRDSEDLRGCFLYRLTENKALSHFSNLVFISSSQDEYVPYESARVEKNNLLLTGELNNSINRAVICEMVDNLIADVKSTQISRMNVFFNIQDRNFDSIVGRTAHIKYLSDQKFIKMFCIVFDKFFL